MIDDLLERALAGHDPELRVVRATQRYASSKAAYLAMYGSLSILAVPQSDFQVLAAASWEVERAWTALGDARARARGRALGAKS